MHYTANPGSTAAENRNYFEGLKDSHETKVSSHFVIGIEGEIVQCIPSSEIAYASNSRNDDTLSIECCHKDETGEFTQATYDSLVKLVGWLCYRFDLKSSDVIRHYDVTEKICPKYFVDHPDAWEQFKKDYISQEGRVIDPSDARKITTSEGQSYGMFFALAANDRAAFDNLLDWTQNNLAQGSLKEHLPAWLWGEEREQ